MRGRPGVLILKNLFDILTTEVQVLRKADESRTAFLYQKKPMEEFTNSLKTACRKANIIYDHKIKGGFTFHDLIHTFVTNASKSGVPDSVVIALVGHTTRKMFDRYNLVGEETKRAAINRFENSLPSVDQTVEQSQDKNSLTE